MRTTALRSPDPEACVPEYAPTEGFHLRDVLGGNPDARPYWRHSEVNTAMDKCPKPQKNSSKCVIGAKAYREGLGPQERARYLEKLWFIGGTNPYELAPSSWINDDPDIAYPDIVNYVVFSPSPYTAEDLKSYKSLEAYNQMVCGWVREMQYQVINDRCVVNAKVSNAIIL